MTNLEMFRNKNPQAPHEYCDFAAMLYSMLLRKDAFEYGIQIENFHSSFKFLFPHGGIIIAYKSPFRGMEPVPCYICNIKRFPYNCFCFGPSQLESWLQNNWDDLIIGDEDE